MTAIAKRILITSETHEVLVARTDYAAAANGVCPLCNQKLGDADIDGIAVEAALAGGERADRFIEPLDA